MAHLAHLTPLNPSKEAPLEKVFAEYMMEAGKSLKIYSDNGSPQAMAVTSLWYRMIWRAMFHFLRDHLVIVNGDAAVEREITQTTDVIEDMAEDGTHNTLNWRIVKTDTAWKNEPDPSKWTLSN